MITLITMGQGNPIALGRTLESFAPMCNEVIYGDMLIFQEDREIVQSYQDKYNMKIVKYPPSFIFHNGFSVLLNDLASKATNDFVLYMNTSEIMNPCSKMDTVKKTFIEKKDAHNCFVFTHLMDSHRWIRLYNRKELSWGGIIHEEVHPRSAYRLYGHSLFVMADTPKDDDAILTVKGRICNDIKEFVYFAQLIRLAEGYVDGITNPGWITFAKDGYEHKKRLFAERAARLEAFKNNDLETYIKIAEKELA